MVAREKEVEATPGIVQRVADSTTACFRAVSSWAESSQYLVSIWPLQCLVCALVTRCVQGPVVQWTGKLIDRPAPRKAVEAVSHTSNHVVKSPQPA